MDTGMKILVQKFGGTSVAKLESMKQVREKVLHGLAQGYKVIVVLSARAGETNQLLALAGQWSTTPDSAECDALVATGEQVSISLFTMLLKDAGIRARSLLGWQIPITTDDDFGRARILSINSKALYGFLKDYDVLVVAGFQGCTENGRITTLGRGGSDTSAVALAAALGSAECEIYTDVDGVYTTDPNKVDGARKLAQVSYDEMLELASLGAGVLHSRAVEFAKKYNVVIHVKSSFNFNEGTKIVNENDMMEKILVTGVTLKNDDARITVADIPDKPGIAAELFGALAEKKINIDVIVQSSARSQHGAGDTKTNTISFTTPVSSVKAAQEILDALTKNWGAGIVSTDEKIAIVSAVGVGMKSHTGVAASMFKILAENNINIEMISTSEIKISCVIAESRGADALRLIHNVFGLDKTA